MAAFRAYLEHPLLAQTLLSKTVKRDFDSGVLESGHIQHWIQPNLHQIGEGLIEARQFDSRRVIIRRRAEEKMARDAGRVRADVESGDLAGELDRVGIQSVRGEHIRTGLRILVDCGGRKVRCVIAEFCG